MTVLNGELFVAGHFAIGNDSIVRLARYDGLSWEKFSIDDEIRCLLSDNNTLYIGGKFTNVSGEPSTIFCRL
jgi:hypothetical protein